MALVITSIENVTKLYQIYRLLDPQMFNNDVAISMSFRTKFNGTSTKTNIVVRNSHVTLYCKVSFNKNQQYLFNLMMVSITLPDGESVFPGSCTVDMENAFKRCKIVIKRVSAADQGKYRCHAQYFSGSEIIEKYDDIILREYFFKTIIICLICIFHL